MENFQDKIIYFDIEVNELYAMIDITQTYRNISNTSLEIKIKLPKTKNQLLKFTAKINEEKLFQSKVLDIEKAKEKYTDSFSSGNTGLIAYQSDDDFTVINIGNLLYDDILELTTTYYQLLSKYNNKSFLDLNFDYPCFLDCNFNQINTDINNIEIFSNIRFNTFYNLTNVNIDNLSSKQYSKEIDKNSGKYNISYNEKINKIIPIKIIFESDNNEKNLLFIQNNEKFKETSYFLNYKIPEEITETKMDINQDPILFIFVLDQSGSMRGTPLDLVKTSLKIFLHSLPQNSYFQLIGFGSTFIKYNDTPIKFTPENIRNLDNLIDNLNAKLGGTYLLSPMEDILGNNDYTNFNNSKHLFILTDGEVELKNETLDYIIKNQKDFIIHSLGYGDDFDKNFIQTIGSLPECTYDFVTDINEINAKIILILELCSQIPIKNLNIDSNIKSNISYSNINNNRLLNYGFITNTKENEINLKFKFDIADKNEEIKINFNKKNIVELPDGNILSKIIISNLLKDKNNNLSQDNCLELSKKYEVLSKYTALYVEIIDYRQKNKNGILPLTFISRGENYICNNYRIKPKIYMPKTGKHGHAKAIIKYTDPITGKSYENTHTGSQFKKLEIINKKKNDVNSKNNNFDLNRIMLTQDLMEGFWDSNDETKKIVNEIKDIYDKADNTIKGLMTNSNDNVLYNRILHTFIIIYFIENKAMEKIVEFKLIIEKGKKFLKKNNIEFETICENLFK